MILLTAHDAHMCANHCDLAGLADMARFFHRMVDYINGDLAIEAVAVGIDDEVAGVVKAAIGRKAF